MRTAALSAAVLLAATTAYAQPDEVARRATLESARVPLEKAMTGAPYSAETLVEGVQTLADGNRIVRKTTGRVYRDGEGRTRREEEGQSFTVRTANGPASTTGRTSISIVDPVEGFSYSLDPQNKVAWRTPIGTSSTIMGKLEAARVEDVRKKVEEMTAQARERTAREGGSPTPADEQKMAEARARGRSGGGGGGRGGAGAIAPAPGEVRMRGTAEGYAYASNPGPIERKTIEGVLVEGRKTTTIIPAGLIGNEQPLTIVSEEWRSPELNVLVMTRYSDPRTGESTYRLINISRAEPDHSLFTVPSDYEVKDTTIRRMEEVARRKD